MNSVWGVIGTILMIGAWLDMYCQMCKYRKLYKLRDEQYEELAAMKLPVVKDLEEVTRWYNEMR